MSDSEEAADENAALEEVREVKGFLGQLTRIVAGAFSRRDIEAEERHREMVKSYQKLQATADSNEKTLKEILSYITEGHGDTTHLRQDLEAHINDDKRHRLSNGTAALQS